MRQHMLHVRGEGPKSGRSDEVDRCRRHDFVAVVDERQERVVEASRVRMADEVTASDLLFVRQVLEHWQHGAAKMWCKYVVEILERVGSG